MTEVKALFAGSFDPLTVGHVDIVRRAQKVFKSIHIGVGHSSDKKGMIPVSDRLELIRQALGNQPEMSVGAYTGLTVDYAKEVGAQVLIRGVRNLSDFQYEMTMSSMNRQLSDQLETIFFPAKAEHAHISSSLVKEIAVLGGDVSGLVPSIVEKKLKTFL